MTRNRLTIGIPTRNRARSVTRLVEACLSQTEPPFEIIVSDNASDDDTLDQLAALSSPLLVVISQQTNIGMVPNWNACLDAARGDFFVLISDDDMVDIDFVESITALLNKTPMVDLAIVCCRIADDFTGQTSSNPPPSLHAGEIDFVNCVLPDWLSSKFYPALAGMIFRTSRLQEVGGFCADWPFAADAATWLPLAMHGKCSLLPEAKLTYRIHNGATTATTGADVLIRDTERLMALINYELTKVVEIDTKTRQILSQMSRVYLRAVFGAIMIRAARNGVSKGKLLRVWISWGGRLPGFGLSSLSLGALLVPKAFIPWVGAPYRWWSRHRRVD